MDKEELIREEVEYDLKLDSENDEIALYRISNEKDLKDNFIKQNETDFELFKRENFNIFLADEEYINDYITEHKDEFDDFVKEDFREFKKVSED